MRTVELNLAFGKFHQGVHTMKYFTKELFAKFNTNLLPSESQYYDKVWRDNLLFYWSEFDKIKNELPDNFVKIFKSGQLHDALMEDLKIYYKQSRKELICYVSIRLKSDTFYCDLIHQQVNNVDILFENLAFGINSEYLYGEVLKESSGLLTHNFLLSSGGEAKITCKNIKWIPVKD